MRMPTMAVAPTRLLFLLATAGLAACAADATAPSSSTLSPTGASRSLVGATDGQYTFVIDPSREQSLEIGPNHLDVPASAICRLSDTSYGPEYWDDKCTPEENLVTITATVRNANTKHPRIDFEPALRFAPDKKVTLFMTLDDRIKRDDWSTILYCSTTGRSHCVDEARRDRSLETSVRGHVVSRRIKHFSGYLVSGRYGEER